MCEPRVPRHDARHECIELLAYLFLTRIARFMARVSAALAVNDAHNVQCPHLMRVASYPVRSMRKMDHSTV